MTPYELFKNGDLHRAVEAALNEVKSSPTDVDRRLMLCDLLSFENQFERADKQLEIIVQQDAGLSLGVALYRQILRAAISRQEVWEQGRPPEFMGVMPESIKLHILAFIARREGNDDEASDLLRRADGLRLPSPGDSDGVPFQDFRDLDDFSAPFLEVLTSTGKYYWVDWMRIQSLEFHKPKLLRDLLWRPAELSIRSGPSAEVYVPALYASTHRSEDQSVRVGQRTDWVELAGGAMVGSGQREFFLGEDARTILSLNRISFSSTEASAS